ncbi:glycosyl hydrolase [Streptomyces sp. NPDC048417]|uniref:glycosyl hydrolase n=1 Tax=Streptomyces sp. NPDC048417 TaxID=3155387 RepID=UPI00342FB146
MEGCATLNQAYAQTWPQVLKHVRANFAHGVNQVVYHGFSTEQGLGVKDWPGFSPFVFGQGGNGFSEAWGPRQPTWAGTDKITGWTTRMQWVLRQGSPQVDLVIYRHSYGNDVRTPDGAAGFTYDFAGPDQLEGTWVRGSRLAPDGPAYRALILDRRPTLPVATARQLLSHAGSGLPVVIVGDPLGRTPGAYRPERQDDELAGLLEKLLKHPSVRHVTGQDGLLGALRDLGVRPAVETSRGTGSARPAPHRAPRGASLPAQSDLAGGHGGRRHRGRRRTARTRCLDWEDHLPRPVPHGGGRTVVPVRLGRRGWCSPARLRRDDCVAPLSCSYGT